MNHMLIMMLVVIFQSDIVFYYDPITANELNGAEFDRLDFYI